MGVQFCFRSALRSSRTGHPQPSTSQGWAKQTAELGQDKLPNSPLTSLHEMDLLDVEHDSEKYEKTLGDANRTKLHNLFAASVDREKERYYCADPSLSYVTPAWIQPTEISGRLHPNDLRIL